jgi:hypothetical protein
MNAQAELDALLEQAKALGVKIVYKEGWFWKALAWLVLIVTFGQNKFFDQYITTVYKTIGVPRAWDSWPAISKLEILTHELCHVQQLKKWTPPGFFLCYLLFPLPFGLAWCRYRIEREAYVAGFAVLLRYKVVSRAVLIEHVVEEMSGAGYGWAWPFSKSVRKWFEENVPHV